MPLKRAAGYTLTEIMTVCAIVGVLAAVALPAYDNSIRRTHRGLARTLLSDVASRNESWYTDHKGYTGSLGADGLNYVAGSAVGSMYLDSTGRASASSTNAIYRIALATTASGGNLLAYTASATPLGRQLKDTECGTLTLASTGATTASGPKGQECWSR